MDYATKLAMEEIGIMPDDVSTVDHMHDDVFMIQDDGVMIPNDDFMQTGGGGGIPFDETEVQETVFVPVKDFNEPSIPPTEVVLETGTPPVKEVVAPTETKSSAGLLVVGAIVLYLMFARK